MFSERLKRELEQLAKIMPRLDEEERLLPILYSLAKQSLAKEYQIGKTTAQGILKLIRN
jgi:DNA primase large subunit